VATLALGIGANTAIFSVVDVVLLRPLPYHDSDRLVMLWRSVPADGVTEGFVSYPDFRDWQAQSESFDALTAFWAFANGNVNLTGGLEPERVPVARVMSGYFELLGVSPLHGRTFLPEENVVGNHRVAILSHALWQRQFGGDPDLVGQPVHVNGFPYTVVGIMPPGFRPVGTLALGDEVELWRPLAPDDNQTGGRGSNNLRVIGRLAPGISLAEAQSEMHSVAQRLATEYPDTNVGATVRILPLQEQVVQNVRPALVALLVAVGLVLLIACVNVANLLLVRGAANKKHVAIHTALGAGRGAIVRQHLTESVLLGLLGGGAGTILAMGSVAALAAFGPSDIPMLADVRIDGRVLVFTSVVAVSTGLLFGLVPALQFSKANLTDTLRQGGQRSVGAGHRRLTNGLVVTEVALSMMLLIAAGLLLRSFDQLLSVEPGFDPEGVLTLQVELPMATTYPSQDQRDRFFADLLERIDANPQVISSSITNAPPMGEGGFATSFAVPDQPDLSTEGGLGADLQVIDPQYFSTMRIPLMRGRVFTAFDSRSAPNVIIINQSMAETLWPGTSPLGKRIRLGFGAEGEVVGVVPDVKMGGLDAAQQHTIYWPSLQMPYNFMTVVIRTSGDPLVVAPAVRNEIRKMDADLPVYNLRSMDDLVDGSVAQQRFQMLLLSSFAGLALVLALVGIYGVISYAVAQRTHELGIRIALGAQARDAVLLIARQGLLLALAGTALGLLGAALLSRFMASLLFGIGILDPVTFVLAPLALATVGGLAAYLPARRAARVDPMIALRGD
jgi:putative ABC transport system permease protein